MLHKIRGIVLKTTNYNESSVVVQIFTDQFGLQSYLLHGVKKPKSKISMNMLQPLHLIDIIANHRPNISLQKASEIRPAPAFKSIPYHILKSAVAMFLNEVLYKCIKHQGTDEKLFDFLFNAINWLDTTETMNPNFHLSFLLKLTRYLGFAPAPRRTNNLHYFDLLEGDYTQLPPPHPNYIDVKYGDLLETIYTTSFEHLEKIQINLETRRYLIANILLYYQLHTPSFGDIHSLLVLEEILS